ncbi:MAG: SLBB domain-containing protein [Acidobacteria bacterium]|nr:SLBB domain-containing protein [Acidobacteriota bacterium]
MLKAIRCSLALPILWLSIGAYGQATQEQDRVHFGDIVDVDFVGGFEFDWRGGLTVDGNLDGLAEADPPIHALCRTEAEIASDIQAAYSKILRDPKVNVKIVDRSNRAVVRLYGAVRTPSRFKLMRAIHLRELLVLSGGLTDDSSGDISIFRPREVGCEQTAANGETVSRTMKIQISDLIAGKPDADPEILSGDVVTAERASAVYVIGAVNNPRPIYSRSEMTVSRAIATAGGLAKEADGRRITILRRDGGETRSIDVDLLALKTDPSKDAVLKPFDIIDVASRGGGKRKLPPQPEQNSRNSTKTEPPLRIVD